MRGIFAPCNNAWCPECYEPLGNLPFPIKSVTDEEGAILESLSESKRFLIGRAGDQLMTPFQCELCHFRNVMLRDPVLTILADNEILELMRRANLDAFWGRETNTVKNNLRAGLRMEKTMSRLGMPCVNSPMGPFPLKDGFGMQAAVAVLDRSLDEGKHDVNVQFETFRRVRFILTNIEQATPNGLGDVIGAYERNRMWISRVPTHSFWFSRFMQGIRKRVGQVVKQDWPIPIDTLHAVQNLLEQEWNHTGEDEKRKKQVAEIGVWFIGGFCVGLRGEEMLLIEYAGTKKSIELLTNPEAGLPSHFYFTVTGRTKGNQISGAKFNLPCVGVTSGTGLRPGKWILRLVGALERRGKRGGRLFERNMRPAKLVEFQEDFFCILEKVQETTNTINKDLDIREAAGILRTIRKGQSAHAMNMEVGESLVHTINRWKQETKDKDNMVGSSMLDRYANLTALKPTLLRYSDAF